MPELPDLTLYVDALNERLTDSSLDQVHMTSPFLLRTVAPVVEDFYGRRFEGCKRLAKQLVLGFEGDFYMVLHLMIAGRLRWSDTHKPPSKRNGLAAFEFSSGTLLLTEASKKKRASLRLVQGSKDLAELDPGGLEVLGADREAFGRRLASQNHTLKRALTDQRIFAGIGNAYSDEILLRSGLSPFKQSQHLNQQEVQALYEASQTVLGEWIERLRRQANGKFPAKVTAFHEEMVAHGKYKAPCAFCGAPIQRIVYAQNEANYCPRCQTDGRLLADRSLSKLLKDTWPKRLEDLENF